LHTIACVRAVECACIATKWIAVMIDALSF